MDELFLYIMNIFFVDATTISVQDIFLDATTISVQDIFVDAIPAQYIESMLNAPDGVLEQLSSHISALVDCWDRTKLESGGTMQETLLDQNLVDLLRQSDDIFDEMIDYMYNTIFMPVRSFPYNCDLTLTSQMSRGAVVPYLICSATSHTDFACCALYPNSNRFAEGCTY